MPVVRHRGRGGGDVLYVGVPEVEDHGRPPLRLGGPSARGDGDDAELRARRPEVRRPEWRARVHVQRGGLVPGVLRDPGRGRLVLEHALRGRAGRPVRLAEGQVRPVVADRPDSADGAARGSGSREVATRHGRHDGDEEDRRRRPRAGRGSGLGVTSAAVHDWLGRLGVERTAPVEVVHDRPWSRVLRISTAEDDLYLKQCAPVQAFEVPLTVALAARWPDRMPEVVAAAYEPFFEHGHGLEPDEVARLRALAPRYRELCEELEAYGLPASIQHDDLHDGNVLVRDGRVAILDWGDPSLGHPLWSWLKV